MYVTLNSSTIPLSVEKGKDDGQNVLVTPHDQQEIHELASDIRYIKTETKQGSGTDQHFFGTWKFWSYATATPLLFFVLLAVRRKRALDESDPILMKSRRAGRLARKRLALADKHLRAGKKDLFYEEVLSSMNDYICQRLNITPSELSKDKMNEMLRERLLSEEVIASINSIIDTCEFARYAPGGGVIEMGNMYNDALHAIIRTEEHFS